MSSGRRYLAALTVGAALLGSSGCGSSDKEEGKPLPSGAVATLNQRLDEVQRRYDVATQQNKVGACHDIENDSYKAIDTTVEDLPGDVDADVRKALEESLTRLQDLTREGCSNVKDEPPKTDTTPQETVPQETVPQETAPEQTDTQTTPEKTKPGKDKTKPGKGNGNGNGNGNGVTTPPADTGGQAVPPGEGQ